MAKTKKYRREVLIASDEFKGYQKDFLSVLLKKPEYTLSEARKLVFEFFKEDK